MAHDTLSDEVNFATLAPTSNLSQADPSPLSCGPYLGTVPSRSSPFWRCAWCLPRYPRIVPRRSANAPFNSGLRPTEVGPLPHLVSVPPSVGPWSRRGRALARHSFRGGVFGAEVPLTSPTCRASALHCAPQVSCRTADPCCAWLVYVTLLCLPVAEAVGYA